MTAPLAIARQYQDITEVFRARRIELGLSYEFIDLAGGLAKGHTEAMLGPSAKKGWGQSTFHFLCEILAVQFHAFPDIEAAKRMEQVWEGRKMNQVSENMRISQKLIDKAKPHIYREMQKRSTASKMCSFTVEKRKKISRKACRARARLPAVVRSEISRKGWIKRRKKQKRAGTLLNNLSHASCVDAQQITSTSQR
jgi:hypothetical protein